MTQEILTGQPAGTKTFSYDAFGHRVSMTDTTETGSVKRYSYAYDVHGSASMLLEDTGTVKASYGYQPFRRRRSPSSPRASPPSSSH